ncbi:MAG: head GIN domain-containing protein [Ferruginibacter sp.]
MKKLFLFIAVLFLGMTCFSQDQVVVDPNAEVRSLNENFNAIKISDGIDLYLTQSGTEAVAVSALEDKYKSAIKVIVENNVLKIFYEGDKGWNSRNKQLRAYVSFNFLNRLDASGASDIVVAGSITTDDLKMRFSGASDFDGKVSVKSLSLELSGASDIKIGGNASIVTISCSGASDVNGYKLISDICDANASGASDIYITVNKEMTAHASGASAISFQGSAIIKEVHKSGASSVVKKG